MTTGMSVRAVLRVPLVAHVKRLVLSRASWITRAEFLKKWHLGLRGRVLQTQN